MSEMTAPLCPRCNHQTVTIDNHTHLCAEHLPAVITEIANRINQKSILLAAAHEGETRQ